eukprot:6642036-Alexandrium_andersonii.AAC.1
MFQHLDHAIVVRPVRLEGVQNLLRRRVPRRARRAGEELRRPHQSAALVHDDQELRLGARPRVLELHKVHADLLPPVLLPLE